jgi:hypothetical protein
MRRGFRLASLLVAVVLALTAEACPPNPIDCLKLPNNHLILVTPGGQVSLEEAHVNPTAQNQVVWLLVPLDPLKQLSIQFTVPAGQPQPFVGMKSLGNDKYEVQCFHQDALSLCVSGAISPGNLSPKYSYDQIVKTAAQATTKDGWIIIDK